MQFLSESSFVYFSEPGLPVGTAYPAMVCTGESGAEKNAQA